MTDAEPVPVVPRRRPGAHKAVRPRRRLVIAGVVLTWAGVVMVGWSQVEANRDASAAVREDEAAASALERRAEQIEASWVRGLHPGEVGVLRIPRFDEGSTEFVAPVVEGWDPEDLSRGVGLYDGGARPGEVGNVVLAGHRVTHGSPFADFPELVVGDLVEVETATSIVTYRLITSGTRYRVPDSTVWPTWSTPNPELGRDVPTDQRYLTLVTCAETFHTELRNVAVGVQVAVRPAVRTVAG